jgi:hypothetical protein
MSYFKCDRCQTLKPRPLYELFKCKEFDIIIGERETARETYRGQIRLANEVLCGECKDKHRRFVSV